MIYARNVWETGDIIDASRLNHMEDGIANNLITIVDGADYSTEEIEMIRTALINGAILVARYAPYDALGGILSAWWNWELEEGLEFEYVYMDGLNTLIRRYRILGWDGEWAEPVVHRYELTVAE